MALPYRLLPVILPFAVAYFLSYVLRTVNAVLSVPLTEEFSLSASDLGLLSSAYFVTFALMQIPLGSLLDRKGPRIVESTLLCFAVAGCVITAVSSAFWALWLGRALIGIGVSACLMASYKAFRICFSDDKQASLSSLMLMVGAIGALAATLPVELMLSWMGWRGLFWITALFLLVAIGGLMFVLPKMPEPPAVTGPFWRETIAGTRLVFSNPQMQRLIPFAIFTHGGFLAIQSLWLGPWFRIVDGFSSAAAASALLLLGVVVMCSHLAMSVLGTRLKDWGIRLDRAVMGGALIMLITSFAAVTNLWGNTVLGWAFMIASTAIVGLAYACVALAFPPHMGGRASTSFNFVVFTGAFAIQWGVGLLADLFKHVGYSDGDSLQNAMLIWVLCQALSLAWMWLRQPEKDLSPA